MSFSDYAYNEPYARCMAKADETTIARMEAAWLEGAAHALDVDRTLSTAIYGREIPYVLLMHIGAFDARMLPRLLERKYQILNFDLQPLPHPAIPTLIGDITDGAQVFNAMTTHFRSGRGICS